MGFTLASLEASLATEKNANAKATIQAIITQAKTVSGCHRKLHRARARLSKLGRKIRKNNRKTETGEVYSYILTSDASAI